MCVLHDSSNLENQVAHNSKEASTASWDMLWATHDPHLNLTLCRLCLQHTAVTTQLTATPNQSDKIVTSRSKKHDAPRPKQSMFHTGQDDLLNLETPPSHNCRIVSD